MTLGKEMLPKGWEATEVGEICVDLQYGYTASASREKCGPRFLRITDIQDGKVVWSNVPYCQIDSKEIEKYELHEGDIVFARTGGTVGKSFIIGPVPEKSVFASYLIRLSAHKNIYSQFLFYFFQSLSYWEQIGFKKGGLQGNVNAKSLSSLKLNICSFDEQKRIVAKIDELFSELDKAIENLKTARQQLKIYRQAVLKHAFEGKLTADWREKNKDKLESTKNDIFQKYEGADNLSELPKSWNWINSGSLFSFVTSGSRGWAKYYSDSGAVFIRIGNLDFDSLKLDLSDIQHVSPPKGAEGKRTKVEKGDFLFSITGYLGMFAIAPEIEEAYVNQHIALARPTKDFEPEYVGYYITAKTGGNFYLNELTKGAVKAGLRLDDIRSFPVPLCSINEQELIVEHIKKNFSIIDDLEQTIEVELQKTEALRQSILKKAFSGKLVAQDPKDEPASVLLERIKSEKNESPKRKKKVA